MPLAQWTLGPFAFGAGSLLIGAVAAAAPLILHLMLRPKPPRQPLPTMRFVLQSHAASDRANRLRRLLLLMMRMALMAGAAVLLAQPQLRAARWAPTGSGPVSVALCLDDSASMGYRFEGRTRLDAARDIAASLVNDRTRFGEGSEFVVVRSGGRAPDAARPTIDTARGIVTRQLTQAAVRGHDASVWPMIRRADELLSHARHPRREIYVFTDCTQRAWRDATAVPFSPSSSAAVFIVDVGRAEDANAALTLPAPPSRRVPEGVAVPLAVSVRAGADYPGGVEPIVELRVDGEPKARQVLPVLRAAEVVESSISIPALSSGLHRLTLDLRPADTLAADNERFAIADVGPLPRVIVVGDEVAEVVAAMLAPPSLPEALQRVHVQWLSDARELADALPGSAAVFLVDLAGLDESTWRRLTDFVTGGGMVVTILGDRASPDRYATGGALLPGVPSAVEEFARAARLEAIDLAHPLLAPFRDTGAVDALSSRGVHKAWKLAPIAQGAVVLCGLSGPTPPLPGLVERRIGGGTSLLLTFSPARGWSEFAAQAAPMIVLWHRAIERQSATGRRAAYATVDASMPVAVPGDGPVRFETYTDEQVGTVIVERNAAGPARPPSPATRPVAPHGMSAPVPAPTGEPGHVLCAWGEAGTGPSFGCAINVVDAESDLRRLAPDLVAARFVAGVASVAQDASELTQAQRHHRVGVDAAVPIALLLLALLLAESAFANRFYGRSRREGPAAGAGTEALRCRTGFVSGAPLC